MNEQSDEIDDAILRRRAQALAAPRHEGWAAPASGEVLVLRVRHATYAIATDVVLGVRRLDRISPVPRGVGLTGLSAVEGEIVCVLRLDSVGPAEVAPGNLAVILGRAKPELALLADEVLGIRKSGADAAKAPDRKESPYSDEAIVHLDGVALLRARGR